MVGLGCGRGKWGAHESANALCAYGASYVVTDASTVGGLP
jgi:hypothetical protein